MDVILQAVARAQGLPRFFTGKPCKYGHIAERQTGSGTCLTCKKEKRAEQRKDQAVKDMYAQKCREYRSNEVNRLKANETSRLSKKNREKDEVYRLAHNTANRLWRQAFYQTVEGKIRYSLYVHKRRVASGQMPSTKAVAAMKEAQGGKCKYCNGAAEHLDHIMPIKLGGTNELANLQWLCKTCNLKKGAKHPDDFERDIGYGT